MRTKKLISGETGVADGDALLSRDSGTLGVAQCNISGTATVVLEGRISDAMPWQSIHEFTESGFVGFTRVPLLRGRVTSISSGSVDLEVGLGEG